jgi:flagellar protein FliS
MTINAYNEIAAETEVLDANPHRLIQLMLDRCLQQMQLAKHFMGRKEINKKCEAIAKAHDIIIHLRAALNHNDKEVKQLSEKLNIVYEYIEKCLFKSNLKNDASLLDDAISKLMPIKTSWDHIGEAHENKKHE